MSNVGNVVSKAVISGLAQQGGGIFASFFASENLNAGQQAIAFGYVAPAMEDAFKELADQQQTGADVMAQAGTDSHYAAEQALSDLIGQAADEADMILGEIQLAAQVAEAI